MAFYMIQQMRTPSYAPPHSGVTVHQDILEEERWWQFNPELRLTEEAWIEYRSAHSLMHGFLESGQLQKQRFVGRERQGFASLLGHNKRVSAWSLFLNTELQRMGSKVAADTRILARAAMKHDIGKLDKDIFAWAMYNGALPKTNKAAWNQIERHPSVSREIVLSMKEICATERKKIGKAVLYHHEREDGQGYHKMNPEEVPNVAKIIAVADAMDVMMGRRPYRKPVTTDECIAELIRCRGTQFHPDPVNAAVSLRPSRGDFITYGLAA